MNRRQALMALSAGLIGPGLFRPVTATPASGEIAILDALPAAGDRRVARVELDAGESDLLDSVLRRLERLERIVGYANYNLLDYPGALRIAARYKRVGEFTVAERRFIERIFYADAARFGFRGPRLLDEIDYRITPSQREKIPHSGHYLFKSEALETFLRLRDDVGNGLILTSGIRGVVKQTHLFLARVRYSGGNISDAARSLAPPAYSFHSVGDFDVGQRDFGYANFTRRFTETDVYRRLRSLSYVRNRYPPGNRFGMRFEPWHVEVA